MTSIFSQNAVIRLALLALAMSGAVFADTAQPIRQPLVIVITGSNIPASEEQSSSITTVVSKEDIEQLNVRSVSQLLNSLPGFHVENSSSGGSVNAVYLRGAEPNYTAVLINGIKVNDPTNSRGGAFDFSLLDINTVERVEVVKGPASSLYGSDAMAGVINIITRPSADELRSDLRVEAGSNELVNATASVGQSFANGNVLLKASYADDGEQIEGSAYKSNSVSLSGEYYLQTETQLSVSLSFQDAEAQSFPDASGGPEYAVIRDVDKRDSQQDYHYLSMQHNFNAQDYVKLQFNYFQADEQFDAVGVAGSIPANSGDSNYERQNVLATYTNKVSSQLDISVGTELEWEDGQSNSVIDPAGFNIPADFTMQRRLGAVFAELQYQIYARLQGYVGARYDSPENSSDETSPRFGLIYKQEQTMFRVDWGQGFKLPSFYSLAHPIVGNPDFIPETSESFQLTLQQKLAGKTLVDVNGFWNRYFDLIDFDSTTNLLVQRDEVEINGVEIAIKHNFTQSLLLQFQYTRMNMDIVNSDAELLKRPEELAGLALNWNATKDIVWSTRANYVGEKKDFAFPTGLRTLSSYKRVDTSIGWRWNRHWRTQLAIDNVFDEEYEEAFGFTAPGIRARFSVTASL